MNKDKISDLWDKIYYKRDKIDELKIEIEEIYAEINVLAEEDENGTKLENVTR